MFSCFANLSCCANQSNVVSGLSSVPLPQPPIITMETPISQTSARTSSVFTAKIAPERPPSKKPPQKVARLAFAVGGGSPPPIAPSTYQVFDRVVLPTSTRTSGISLSIPPSSIPPSTPSKKSSRISHIVSGPSSVPVKRSAGALPTSRVITPAPRVSTGASGISLSSIPPSSIPPSTSSKSSKKESIKTSRIIPDSSSAPAKRTTRPLSTRQIPLAISSRSATTPKPKTESKSPIRSNSPHPKKEIMKEIEYISAVFKGADILTIAFKNSKTEINLPIVLETYKKEIESAKPKGFASCKLVLRRGELFFKCYS